MWFEVYTGAANNVAQDKGLGYRVGMGLVEMYLNTNHHVFADNYFTSVPLAEALLRHNIYLCGATRASRKEFPNALGELYIRQGESTKWTNENGVFVKWHDKRDVLSHCHRRRRQGRREGSAPQRPGNGAVPHVVQRYVSMGGVDRLDQLRLYFPIGHSGWRWWKYLFWGFMNIAVVKAYILWKASNRPLPGNKRLHGLKFFKAELVLNLCNPAIAMRSRRVAPPTQQPEALYTVQLYNGIACG